jgi:hypothetical protein
MENQHILLIDTRAAEGKQRFFSLRHLIVGVSRATHQDFVHVDPSYEAILMSGAKDWAQKSMGDGGENPADYSADDYDDVNDLALYFNDPDEYLRPCWRPISFQSRRRQLRQTLESTLISTSSLATRASFRKQ